MDAKSRWTKAAAQVTRPLTKIEINELRSLARHPPAAVKRCLELVFILLHVNKMGPRIHQLKPGCRLTVEWPEVQQMLARFQPLIPALKRLDLSPVMADPKLWEYLKWAYLEGDNRLTPEVVRRSNATCAVLFRWFCEGEQRVKDQKALDIWARDEEVAKQEAEEQARRNRRSEEAAKRLREAEEKAKREAAKAEAETKTKQEAEEAAMRRSAAQLVQQEAARARQAAEAGPAPPPGKPPTHKLHTTGGLRALKAKQSEPDPQQSLMCALTGREPPKSHTGPCDKCDGPHHADDCPHYKKARDDHADAWSNYGKKGSAAGDQQPVLLEGARVVRQPGDGSCLFHSLAHGLGGGGASALRRDISDYVANHPREKLNDTPIEDWVKWDSGLSVKDYAARMRTGNHWGGAIEMAVCVKLKGVSVHVYENRAGSYARISSFDSNVKPEKKVINVLYGGRVHYDALEVTSK